MNTDFSRNEMKTAICDILKQLHPDGSVQMVMNQWTSKYAIADEYGRVYTEWVKDTKAGIKLLYYYACAMSLQKTFDEIEQAAKDLHHTNH